MSRRSSSLPLSAAYTRTESPQIPRSALPWIRPGNELFSDPLNYDINARGILISTMNSVTRTFGKLTHRSPGDNARVSNLLTDYEDVDKLLAKVGRRDGGRGDVPVLDWANWPCRDS